MYNKVLIFLVTGMLILGISRLSFAMMCGSSTAHGEHTQVAQAESAEHEHGKTTDTQAHSEEAVNVGNKICPVSGEKIDEKMKATYEYQSKIYNFCCPMCIEQFKNDPEKYIKKVNEELKSESEAKSEEHMMMPESEMSGGMQGSGHQHHEH